MSDETPLTLHPIQYTIHLVLREDESKFLKFWFLSLCNFAQTLSCLSALINSKSIWGFLVLLLFVCPSFFYSVLDLVLRITNQAETLSSWLLFQRWFIQEYFDIPFPKINMKLNSEFVAIFVYRGRWKIQVLS